jgi:hypothetical protein
MARLENCQPFGNFWADFGQMQPVCGGISRAVLEIAKSKNSAHHAVLTAMGVRGCWALRFSQGLDTGSSPVGVTKEIRVGPRVDVFARGLIGIKRSAQSVNQIFTGFRGLLTSSGIELFEYL